jgi:hypothetical protein
MKWRFWTWFFFGLQSSSGLAKLLNRWIFLHALAGISLAYLVQKPLTDVATTFLLPLAGILVGLSFAWAGNAQAMLQTEELEKLSKQLPDGIETYLYTFQEAILIILVTMTLWGLAALGLFCAFETLAKVILFFLASLALRECWHVVLGSQVMILARYTIRQHEKK